MRWINVALAAYITDELFTYLIDMVAIFLFPTFLAFHSKFSRLDWLEGCDVVVCKWLSGRAVWTFGWT